MLKLEKRKLKRTSRSNTIENIDSTEHFQFNHKYSPHNTANTQIPSIHKNNSNIQTHHQHYSSKDVADIMQTQPKTNGLGNPDFLKTLKVLDSPEKSRVPRLEKTDNLIKELQNEESFTSHSQSVFSSRQLSKSSGIKEEISVTQDSFPPSAISGSPISQRNINKNSKGLPLIRQMEASPKKANDNPQQRKTNKFIINEPQKEVAKSEVPDRKESEVNPFTENKSQESLNFQNQNSLRVPLEKTENTSSRHALLSLLGEGLHNKIERRPIKRESSPSSSLFGNYLQPKFEKSNSQEPSSSAIQTAMNFTQKLKMAAFLSKSKSGGTAKSSPPDHLYTDVTPRRSSRGSFINTSNKPITLSEYGYQVSASKSTFKIGLLKGTSATSIFYNFYIQHLRKVRKAFNKWKYWAILKDDGDNLILTNVYEILEENEAIDEEKLQHDKIVRKAFQNLYRFHVRAITHYFYKWKFSNIFASKALFTLQCQKEEELKEQEYEKEKKLLELYQSNDREKFGNVDSSEITEFNNLSQLLYNLQKVNQINMNPESGEVSLIQQESKIHEILPAHHPYKKQKEEESLFLTQEFSPLQEELSMNISQTFPFTASRPFNYISDSKIPKLQLVEIGVHLLERRRKQKLSDSLLKIKVLSNEKKWEKETSYKSTILHRFVRSQEKVIGNYLNLWKRKTFEIIPQHHFRQKRLEVFLLNVSRITDKKILQSHSCFFINLKILSSEQKMRELRTQIVKLRRTFKKSQDQSQKTEEQYIEMVDQLEQELKLTKQHYLVLLDKATRLQTLLYNQKNAKYQNIPLEDRPKAHAISKLITNGQGKIMDILNSGKYSNLQNQEKGKEAIKGALYDLILSVVDLQLIQKNCNEDD